MRKMPLNQIAFGKTDAFNELNTFGQECYDELRISEYRQRIYEYVYTRYKGVA